MYRLYFYAGGRLMESYDFHNIALAKWKIRVLTQNGTHQGGHFVIEKI